MYELTGKADNLITAFMSPAKLTLVINEKQRAQALYDELREAEKLSIKISKYRKKRSINANNYAWALINEIANVLRADKDEIYIKMLSRYGQVEKISVVAEVNLKGFVKYFDEIGEGVVKGKRFKHYKVYKGSSEFDTREMSVFIDGVVDEAKRLGIQTETPEELAKMKSLWGEAY